MILQDVEFSYRIHKISQINDRNLGCWKMCLFNMNASERRGNYARGKNVMRSVVSLYYIRNFFYNQDARIKMFVLPQITEGSGF